MKSIQSVVEKFRTINAIFSEAIIQIWDHVSPLESNSHFYKTKQLPSYNLHMCLQNYMDHSEASTAKSTSYFFQQVSNLSKFFRKDGSVRNKLSAGQFMKEL